MVPDIKISGHINQSLRSRIIVRLLSAAAGMLLISIFFIANGQSPVDVVYSIFKSSFGSLYGLQSTISKAIPLIILASGLAMAYSARFYNIGAEGQLIIGAVCAYFAGAVFGPVLPAPVVTVVIILAAFAGGAFWATIASTLKIRFKINEVISTLMLNYIAYKLVLHLVTGPWKGNAKNGQPYTDNLPASAWFSPIEGTYIFIIPLVLAVAAVIVMYFLLFRTHFGYEIRVVGDNSEAARYAGINSAKIIGIAMIFSGGLAGLAGANQVAGVFHYLSNNVGSLTAGYGFTAIIIAWLGRLNPILIVGAAVFFAGILVGGDAIQISYALPAKSVDFFNGTILMVIIASDFFLLNKISINFRKGRNDA